MNVRKATLVFVIVALMALSIRIAQVEERNANAALREKILLEKIRLFDQLRATNNTFWRSAP